MSTIPQERVNGNGVFRPLTINSSAMVQGTPPLEDLTNEPLTPPRNQRLKGFGGREQAPPCGGRSSRNSFMLFRRCRCAIWMILLSLILQIVALARDDLQSWSEEFGNGKAIWGWRAIRVEGGSAGQLARFNGGVTYGDPECAKRCFKDSCESFCKQMEQAGVCWVTFGVVAIVLEVLAMLFLCGICLRRPEQQARSRCIVCSLVLVSVLATVLQYTIWLSSSMDQSMYDDATIEPGRSSILLFVVTGTLGLSVCMSQIVPVTVQPDCH